MAPTVNCPSAPMFQTLARKPMAKPTAHSTSGVALTISSPMPRLDDTGSMKKACSALTGSKPSSRNSTKPLNRVSATASSGVAYTMALEA